MKKNNFYINRAIFVADEAEKMLVAVKRCLNESGGFPIYLDDLKILVDNMCILNVAHNAAIDERFRLEKKKRKHIKKK